MEKYNAKVDAEKIFLSDVEQYMERKISSNTGDEEEEENTGNTTGGNTGGDSTGGTVDEETPSTGNENLGSSDIEEEVEQILDYTVTPAAEGESDYIVGTITSTNEETGESVDINYNDYKELIVAFHFSGEMLTGIEGYGFIRKNSGIKDKSDKR